MIQGFSNWSRRDFNAFCRACEKYGRTDLRSISLEIEGKTEEDVAKYSKVFWERYKDLNGKDFCDHSRDKNVGSDSQAAAPEVLATKRRGEGWLLKGQSFAYLTYEFGLWLFVRCPSV